MTCMVDHHKPVLCEEVISLFETSPNGVWIDATFGSGGHSAAFLKRGAAHVIGIDRDPLAVTFADELIKTFRGRFTFFPGNFSDMGEMLRQIIFELPPISGILFDLGMSSMQIDDPSRGFSFDKDGPLDMRMNPRSGQTAAEMLRNITSEKLTEILRDMADVREAKRVAEAICRVESVNPITRTVDLRKVVFQALRDRPWRYAFRTTVQVFQALRMAVNQEKETLQKGLLGAWKLLGVGGRLIVISYHSGEDRIVKRFNEHRNHQEDGRILFKKPVTPTQREIAENARARSAKLRALEKVSR